MKTTKLFSLLTAAGLTLGLAQSAQAIVMNWSYINEDGFTAWAPSSVNTVDNSGGLRTLSAVVNGTPTNLNWGTGVPTPTNNSSLDIGTGRITGLVDTNGAWVNGVSLTHNNFPITGESLTTATLTSTLQLTALNAPFGSYSPLGDPLSFVIKFFETPNLASGSICADGSIAGSNGCADIFVLTNPGALQTIVTDSSGQIYHVSINPDSGGAFGTLSNAACTAAGAAAGCQGWETIEGLSNTLQPQFRVTVPEPATVALFGLGLLGLGAIRRRKS